LFRRDAEHLPEHAGGVESLDSRFRVLDGSPRKVERKGVLEKKGTRERQEHPVYGRRWVGNLIVGSWLGHCYGVLKLRCRAAVKSWSHWYDLNRSLLCESSWTFLKFDESLLYIHDRPTFSRLITVGRKSFLNATFPMHNPQKPTYIISIHYYSINSSFSFHHFDHQNLLNELLGVISVHPLLDHPLPNNLLKFPGLNVVNFPGIRQRLIPIGPPKTVKQNQERRKESNALLSVESCDGGGRS